MQKQSTNKIKKNSTSLNPLETLRELGTSVAKDSVKTVANVGAGALDQLMGTYDWDSDEDLGIEPRPAQGAESSKPQVKPQTELFNYHQYHERVLVPKEVRELTEVIKQEVKALRTANSALMDEVRDVENAVLNQPTEKSGVYDMRFLETVLELIQLLKKKIHESNTWLQALTSRKAKRGSAFAVRSKNQGTQYSMSQELQVTRNVQ